MLALLLCQENIHDYLRSFWGFELVRIYHDLHVINRHNSGNCRQECKMAENHLDSSYKEEMRKTFLLKMRLAPHEQGSLGTSL